MWAAVIIIRDVFSPPDASDD